MAAHQGRHFCACGCRQVIEIKIHHHIRGIPEFVNGHYSRINNPMKGRRRCANPNWNGGRHINSLGYVLILDSDHRGPGRTPYILEHRHVMEKHFDRKLTRKDEVHHLNGDKADNRIENLMLLTKKEHAQLHDQLLRKKIGEIKYLRTRDRMRNRESYRTLIG